MKKTTSRRNFLGKSAMATTGLALLATGVSAHAFNSVKSPFEGYNPYAPVKTDLRKNIFGKHVQVSGKIYNRDGTATLSDASVEVWHLSPNSKKFRHRAKFHTDREGAYRFITDMPEREMGKAHKIYFRISAKGKSYFTELSIGTTGAYISGEHWEKNYQLGEERLFPTHKVFLNQSNINFNISLNND